MFLNSVVTRIKNIEFLHEVNIESMKTGVCRYRERWGLISRLRGKYRERCVNIRNSIQGSFSLCDLLLQLFFVRVYAYLHIKLIFYKSSTLSCFFGGGGVFSFYVFGRGCFYFRFVWGGGVISF